MELLASASTETSLLFIELGIAVIGLAILARFATKFGFSAIPLYLLAGLAFGNGGIVPLQFGEEFIRVGAEVGVVLLMFMLGVEYSGKKLVNTLRTGFVAGATDLVLNFAPGAICAYLLAMPPMGALVLGGVTYISSSGVVAKILGESGGTGSRSEGLVVRVLVLEDLAMAVYLPILAVLLSGKGLGEASIAVMVALGTVFVILFCAVRFGNRLSNIISSQNDEVVLLSILGLILLVSGVASKLQVSAAVGAFLVGVATSDTLAERAGRLIAPLRDLFAATFFLFFGLQINPATLPPALPVALLLAGITGLTKVASTWWAARTEGMTNSEGVRAGVTLIPRGEFSIVIAGLGAAVEPRLGPLSAAYVLSLAILGPVLAKYWGVRSKWASKAAA